MNDRCRVVLEENGRRLEAEGPRDFVEAQVAAFRGASGTPGNAAGAGSASPLRGGGDGPRSSRVTLEAFIESKGAQTLVERALVAGYYLEKYEREPSWTADRLEELLASVGGPTGAALAEALGEAEAAGRLERLPDDGRFTLTFKGSAHVQSGLSEL